MTIFDSKMMRIGARGERENSSMLLGAAQFENYKLKNYDDDGDGDDYDHNDGTIMN